MSNCFNENKNDNLVTVKDILSESKVFIIPKYQRGFAWGVNEEGSREFNDLWEDIIHVYESGNDSMHYTGALTLEVKGECNNKGLNIYHVVDGQQRLTSIIIIIRTIHQFVSDVCDKNNFDLNDNLLMIDNEQKTYRLSYEDYNSSKFFEEFIYDFKKLDKNEDKKEFENKYFKNIFEVREFVFKALLQYKDDDIKKIYKAIKTKLIFNIHFINKTSEGLNFDPRVAFETINNRGKRLSNLELLKNRLMFIADRLQHDELFDVIDSAWNKIYENLSCKDFELDDDNFLRAHWITHKNLDKSRKNAYRDEIFNEEYPAYKDFDTQEDKNKYLEELKEYINDLKHKSWYWKIINAPMEINPCEEIKEDLLIELDKLSHLPNRQYVKVALLKLISNKSFKSDEKTNVCKYLEKAIFINVALGDDKSDLSELVAIVRKDKDVAEILNEIKSNEHLKCDKESIEKALGEFIKVLKEKNCSFYVVPATKYILYEYDRDICKEEKINVNDISLLKWDESSIEHIFPQTPDEDDKYWNKVKGDVEEEKLKQYINSIGNLLIYDESDNKSISNKPYYEKAFGKGHSYHNAKNVSARRLANNNNYWSLHKIYERQEELIDFIYKRWFEGNSFKDFAEFKQKLKDVLVEQPRELDEKTIKELENDKTQNTSSIKNSESKNIKTEFLKGIKDYFPKKYRIKVKRSNSFEENVFAFSNNEKYGDYIDTSTKVEEKKCVYRYYIEEHKITIYEPKWDEKSNINDWSEVAKDWVACFTRFLHHKRGVKVDITIEKE